MPGNHLGISRSDMRKHVIPYLQDGSSSMDGSSKSGIGFSGDARRKELRMQRAAAADVVETSNGGWPSPVMNFLEELLGITKEEPTLEYWFINHVKNLPLKQTCYDVLGLFSPACVKNLEIKVIGITHWIFTRNKEWKTRNGDMFNFQYRKVKKL